MYAFSTSRPAIAMIELIFSLVVMGITLLAAPIILNMSIQSSTTALQQESVAAAASKISLVLTYPWDEGNTNAITGMGILSPANQDGELNAASRLVAANRAFSSRQYNNAAAGQVTAASLATTFGRSAVEDPNSADDIDDFSGSQTNIVLYNNNEDSNLSLNEGEYILGQNFTMNTNLVYGSDNENYALVSLSHDNPFTAGLGRTNIKLVTVSLTPTGNAAASVEHASTSITLYAFACNIGNGALQVADIVTVP